ncbi:APC family permease [Alicyclobacillus fastidiosus]|uniref:APC family permease n=1 Tax=Alicyclobacillus fastidiosus TaxID=392011 RepID=A0ABV5AJZ7_9BACL|nr:APC family permease [Alicyclobacillus fastidiosus]WEH07806.1 APC family permease [Alicyclobacillus fastidiosus]
MQKLNRQMGTFSLMMTGVGSIIGSGWLFGAQKAAVVAGPAALLAWIVGMVMVLFIGLVYAELGARFPQSGGMVRYAQYSHGSVTGFISGWANWIAIVSVIPIEAEASIQYMSSWPVAWAHALFNAKSQSLSGLGLSLAAILVFIYFLINFWTVRLFARVNTLITILKFVIPGLTGIALLCSAFHGGNFTQHGGFAPFGWSGVLTAVATSGIVFAFNGFTSPINLAGEVKRPNRSVPIAVVGSIVLAAIVYMLLQVAFIGSLSPHMLANGFQHLNFDSPFANLAMAFELNWLAIILFADAFVSPSGTGITYTATTARMIYGISENGWLAKSLSKIHPTWRIPRRAMWLNLGVAYLFLVLFRGWGQLSTVISIATLISYVTGPVSALSFRKIADGMGSRVRIKGLQVLAPIAFAMASLILYAGKWPSTGRVIFVMLIGLPVYLHFQFHNEGFRGFSRHIKSSLWVIAYLAFMILVSYLGSTPFGGIDVLPYGVDLLIVALGSIAFFYWGVKSAWVTPYLERAQSGYEAEMREEEDTRALNLDDEHSATM